MNDNIIGAFLNFWKTFQNHRIGTKRNGFSFNSQRYIRLFPYLGLFF